MTKNKHNENSENNFLIDILKTFKILKKDNLEETKLKRKIKEFYNYETQSIESELKTKVFFSEFNENNKYKITFSFNEYEKEERYKPMALARLYEKKRTNKKVKFEIKKLIYQSYETFISNERYKQ